MVYKYSATTYYTDGQETLTGNELYKRFCAHWDDTHKGALISQFFPPSAEFSEKDPLGFHGAFMSWAQDYNWKEKEIYELIVAAHAMRQALREALPHIRQAGLDSMSSEMEAAALEGARVLQPHPLHTDEAHIQQLRKDGRAEIIKAYHRYNRLCAAYPSTYDWEIPNLMKNDVQYLVSIGAAFIGKCELPFDLEEEEEAMLKTLEASP